MGHPPEPADRLRSSRRRYRAFVQDYRAGRLDAAAEAADSSKSPPDAPLGAGARPGNRRREHLRAYLRWLRPHRGQAVGVFLLALVVAGMEMVDPLFMRFIVDR